MRLRVFAKCSSTYDDQKESRFMSDGLKFYGFVIFNNMATNIYKSNERCYLAKDNVNMQVEFFFKLWFPDECTK